MPRITIAAVLATLLMVAPAASARPADLGYPAYPTPEVAAQPNVMPERTTDHPAPTARDITNALEMEKYYSQKGSPDVVGHSALVLEQESTSGSGNQGPAHASTSAPAPAPSDDDAPWLIVALGIAGAALGAAALTVVVRRNRTRAGVAA
jgi:hypothetical protein